LVAWTRFSCVTSPFFHGSSRVKPAFLDGPRPHHADCQETAPVLAGSRESGCHVLPVTPLGAGWTSRWVSTAGDQSRLGRVGQCQSPKQDRIGFMTIWWMIHYLGDDAYSNTDE
jgi:hypothetical protein